MLTAFFDVALEGCSRGRAEQLFQLVLKITCPSTSSSRSDAFIPIRRVMPTVWGPRTSRPGLINKLARHGVQPGYCILERYGPGVAQQSAGKCSMAFAVAFSPVKSIFCRAILQCVQRAARLGILGVYLVVGWECLIKQAVKIMAQGLQYTLGLPRARARSCRRLPVRLKPLHPVHIVGVRRFSVQHSLQDVFDNPLRPGNTLSRSDP